MSGYFWKYLLPGIILIVCAFWAGTLPNTVFALLGFLSFFTAGVALIIEGKKSLNGQRATRNEKTDR